MSTNLTTLRISILIAGTILVLGFLFLVSSDETPKRTKAPPTASISEGHDIPGKPFKVVAPPKPKRSKRVHVGADDCIEWWTNFPKENDLEAFYDGVLYTGGYPDFSVLEFSSLTGSSRTVFVLRYPKTGLGPNGCNREDG